MGEIPSLGEKYCKVDSDQLLPSYEDHGQSAIDMKMSPTIGIITALPKEYAAVAALFKNSREYFTTEAGNNQRYTIGEVPAAQGDRHTVVLALLPVMGIGMAAARTALLLEHFLGCETF
jgi:nucleoside phosphorylase